MSFSSAAVKCMLALYTAVSKNTCERELCLVISMKSTNIIDNLAETALKFNLIERALKCSKENVWSRDLAL